MEDYSRRSENILKSYERAEESSNYNKKVLYLFILMMCDYIITYLGINTFGVIEEANPILVWLFEAPLLFGLAFRMFYAGFMAFLCVFIFEQGYQHYNAFINLALFINSVVVFMHMRWIGIFFMQVIGA